MIPQHDEVRDDRHREPLDELTHVDPIPFLAQVFEALEVGGGVDRGPDEGLDRLPSMVASSNAFPALSCSGIMTCQVSIFFNTPASETEYMAPPLGLAGFAKTAVRSTSGDRTATSPGAPS